VALAAAARAGDEHLELGGIGNGDGRSVARRDDTAIALGRRALRRRLAGKEQQRGYL
jgi:hypothetical protein